MVETQLVARDIRNNAVLDAMRAIPREEFVPEDVRAVAYEDAALPIGAGQTISQPFVVARMIALADPKPGDKALEVGAGSGYAAAVLGRLCAYVYGIERIESLAMSAKTALSRIESDNVDIIHGDGARGLPDEAPFDIILVSAGGAEIPETLKDQLAVGGRLIMPVRRGLGQVLTRVKREGTDAFQTETFDMVMFVPFVTDGDHDKAH